MTWEPEVAEIARRRQLALQMGGEQRVTDQHARGKLTARERVHALVDAGSWRERGALGGSAVYDGAELTEFMPKRTVYGLAQIDGRPVAVSADDFTARPGSGSAGERGRGGDGAMRGADHLALAFKVPCIRLIDGFGGDIRAVAGMSRTYIPEMSITTTVAMLNEVPLVTAALGSVAGGPAAIATASHFSVMVKGLSQVFAAGPPVVRRALGVEVDKEELGGYQIHTRKSGVIDNEAENEADAFRQIRTFLSYLPSNVHELPPELPCGDPPDRREEALLSFIPRNRNRPYNVRRLVELIVDRGSAFEIGRYFGGAQVTMLARLGGKPVGVLANDPLVYGGSMDAAAAQKAEKFVELCDLFSLPVVNLADQPGFLIGVGAESAGTLKHGMRLFTAMEYLSIPWATVIVRRLYGVAGAAHQSHSHWNYRIAWPSGEWGSLPVEGGVAAAYRREIEAAPDPAAYAEQLEARLAAMRSPFRTAEALNIEDLIDPRDTRPLLCEWIDLMYTKRIPTILGPKRRGMRP
ncbi:MAG TPA: carboxyl transferase domain-containing protein [Dehalococcoidia bacterium]|nr:carboxyl transferase domain-containing protein [Dehalococcoidia bacterium]